MKQMYRLLEPLTDGNGVIVLEAGEYLIDDGVTAELYHPDSGENFYVSENERETMLDLVDLFGEDE